MEINRFNIIETGHSQLTLKNTDLKSGIYIYSLIINKKVIATKQMIITK